MRNDRLWRAHYFPPLLRYMPEVGFTEVFPGVVVYGMMSWPSASVWMVPVGVGE